MVTVANTPPRRAREDEGTDRSENVLCYSFATGVLVGVVVSMVLIDVVTRAPLGTPRGIIGDPDNSYVRSPGNGYIVSPDRATSSDVQDDASLCDVSLGTVTAEAARANVDTIADEPHIRTVTGDKEFDYILHKIFAASASGTEYLNYRYDADDCTAMEDGKCTAHIRGQTAQLYADWLRALGFKVFFGKMENVYFMDIGWGSYVQTDYAGAVSLLHDQTTVSANQ